VAADQSHHPLFSDMMSMSTLLSTSVPFNPRLYDRIAAG
jgi:hypothetical protein